MKINLSYEQYFFTQLNVFVQSLFDDNFVQVIHKANIILNGLPHIEFEKKIRETKSEMQVGFTHEIFCKRRSKCKNQNYSNQNVLPSNQLFTDFSICVTFTKFLPKMR